MNHRTTHRDLESELKQFISQNADAMTVEAYALLVDVHSLLVHRTGEATAAARQRDTLGAIIRDKVTSFHALRVVHGELAATAMVPTIQRELDAVVMQVHAIGQSRFPTLRKNERSAPRKF